MKKFIIIFFLLFCFLVINREYNVNYSIEKDFKINSEKWYIDIPKLSLYKEIKDNNDVDHNVIILKPIEYPNKKKSTMILAAHSGNSIYSYFNDLYKLKINDVAFIHNNNKIYSYSLVNTYVVKKTGKVKIYKNDKISNLILITCTNNDKNTQTIYVFEQK